jgi:hypothetical protein
MGWIQLGLTSAWSLHVLDWAWTVLVMAGAVHKLGCALSGLDMGRAQTEHGFGLTLTRLGMVCARHEPVMG